MRETFACCLKNIYKFLQLCEQKLYAPFVSSVSVFQLFYARYNVMVVVVKKKKKKKNERLFEYLSNEQTSVFISIYVYKK